MKCIYKIKGNIVKKIFFIFLSLILSISSYAVEKLVVIGKGPAGCSAAIFAGQAQLFPFVVEGQECDGQLTMIKHIENYPGFPEGIDGEELVERMRLQAERFGAYFKNNYIVKANFLVYPFQLILDNGVIIHSRSVIIATGSSPRWLGVPHEEALKGRGVSASATCDGYLFNGKSVVVAGGGNAALEQALVLSEYAKQVTILHRGSQMNASPYLLERVKSLPKMHVMLQVQIQEILGEEEGWVSGIVYKNLMTDKLETLPCEGLFVAIGRKPNTDLFVGQIEMDGSGFIIPKQGTTMTSIPGIFAAGDITFHAHRKVVTAAASGCVAASEAIRYLNEHFP
jgi:thioredoxin reductase (NADPH)